MTRPHEKLIGEIDAFITKTGIGETYFGAKAINNSALVARLKDGRRIWPDTEAEIRAFIKTEGARL